MGNRDITTGTAISLAGIVLLSFDTVLIRLADTGAWEVAFWRGMLIAFTTTIVLFSREKVFFTEKIKREGYPLVVSGILWGLGGTFFVISVKMTVAANVLVMLSLSPLFAGVGGYLMMGEKMKKETILLFLVTAAGVWIIFSGGIGGGTLAGNLIGLLVPVTLGTNLAWMRKFRHISRTAAVITGGYAAAFIALFFASPLMISVRSMVYLSLLGLVAIPFAQLLISSGTKYLPAPRVALIMMLETVLGPVWVWAFMGEVPPARTFAGGFLILAGVMTNAVSGIVSEKRRFG